MAGEVPQLFDAVKSHRALERAQRSSPEPFLLDRAAEDLCERLAPVLRDFGRICDLGTPYGRFGAAIGAARGKGLVETWSEFPELVSTARSDQTNHKLDLPDLHLPPASFDLVVSGMLLHRVDDLPGVLIQIRRALVADGLFIAAFPGGDSLHELRDVLLRAEAEINGSASLRVLPAIDVRSAGQLLQRAQFALPVADSERLTLRYADLFGLVRDLRAMGSTASILHRALPAPLTRAVILRAAELYREHHADADGRIRATIELVWMSGWAPHASQQKPLRPGSAKTRLADALARATLADEPK